MMNDLISRQAAIDLLDEFEEGIENGDRSAYTRTREKMCELPSARPERKKGSGMMLGHLRADAPNCGADMR